MCTHFKQCNLPNPIYRKHLCVEIEGKRKILIVSIEDYDKIMEQIKEQKNDTKN